MFASAYKQHQKWFVHKQAVSHLYWQAAFFFSFRAFVTVLLAAGALGATKHGAPPAVAPKVVAPTVVAPEAADAPPALSGAINLMEPELKVRLSPGLGAGQHLY